MRIEHAALPTIVDNTWCCYLFTVFYSGMLISRPCLCFVA